VTPASEPAPRDPQRETPAPPPSPAKGEGPTVLGPTGAPPDAEPVAAESPRGSLPALVLVCLVFFLSGGPALLYQLVWQRSLFAIYGINVESVTVIVAAFMLGLGLGSLLGGVLSQAARVPLLLVFGLVELGIGAFGHVSLDLLEAIGDLTLGLSAPLTGLVTFGLVLVPTLLMGATLPLLVAYLVERSGNVGRSVGLLYFVNTLGSAAACFLAAIVLFRTLGQAGTVRLAVAVNLTVGVGAILAHFLAGRKPAGESADSPLGGQGPPAVLSMRVALLLVFLCGLISISYEVVWFRVYAFASQGLVASFALLLGSFLLGIALGSLLARSFCPTVASRSHLRALAGFVGLANVLGFLVVPGIAWLLPYGFPASLPLVVLASAALGATFPLVCHLGVRPGPRAGVQVSYLYLANIIGSTGGSLLTGFVLLDHLSLQRVSLVLAGLGLCLVLTLAASGSLGRDTRAPAMGVTFAVGVVLLLASRPLYDDIYQRLQRHLWGQRLVHVVETRSGVITVDDYRHIYGGGIYDGVFSIELDPPERYNCLIERAYAISGWHPAPRDVLMIGLSSGSWAQVVANHPQLERLTIVEINPGYLELLRRYPMVESLLTNPKVEIVIDDGRRYLMRNPGRRYDVIVMNTIHNWRAHATHLVSDEFMHVVRDHLAPGGAMVFNTTDSDRVERTAGSVFPYGMRMINCMVVSDAPLDIDLARLREVLEAYEIDGEPVVRPGLVRDEEALVSCLTMFDGLTARAQDYPSVEDYWAQHEYSSEPHDSILWRTRGAEKITEDNMGTEWAHAYQELVKWWRGEGITKR
jgi:spermidine synthase